VGREIVACIARSGHWMNVVFTGSRCREAKGARPAPPAPSGDHHL